MGGGGGGDCCGGGRGHRGMGMDPSCHRLYPGTGMEPGHPVDDPVRGVGPDGDFSAVRSDGEEMRGAIECGHGHPAAVTAD